MSRDGARELARELRWSAQRARLRVSEAMPAGRSVGVQRAVRIGVVTQAALAWLVLLTVVLPGLRAPARPADPFGALPRSESAARCARSSLAPSGATSALLPVLPAVWYLFDSPPRGRALCPTPPRRQESHALRG